MPGGRPGTARPLRRRSDVPFPGTRAPRLGLLAVSPGAPRRGHRGSFRSERIREDDAARRRQAGPARPPPEPPTPRRRPPGLPRAGATNRPDEKGRRPFDRNRVFSDEATLACALVPDGGSPEKRYVVLPGRVAPQELQERLLEGRDWLKPDEYRRVLDYAGVSRSLMHILAIEQGRADELSRQDPGKLFRWVMEARGSQQVLDRYNGARRRYEDSAREVDRQRLQLSSRQAELTALERKIRRLDEYVAKRARAEEAEARLSAERG